MPKPVCLKCGLFFKPTKTAVGWEEMMPVDSDWRPYKLWMGDLMECRGCGAEIISGHGGDPIAIQHEDGYDRIRSQVAPVVCVEDC